LLYAIDTERIIAIRVGKSVLISVRSLNDHYPKKRRSVQF